MFCFAPVSCAKVVILTTFTTELRSKFPCLTPQIRKVVRNSSNFLIFPPNNAHPHEHLIQFPKSFGTHCSFLSHILLEPDVQFLRVWLVVGFHRHCLLRTI